MRRKRRSRNRKFPFIFTLNLTGIFLLIFLLYFRWISPLISGICIFSVVVIEILISYKKISASSIKNYFIIIFFDEKNEKKYLNSNFITLVAALLTIIAPFIYSNDSKYIIENKKQFENNIELNGTLKALTRNSSSDLIALFKTNEIYLKSDFSCRISMLDATSRVFYLILSLNDTTIQKLINYPINSMESFMEINSYCRNQLKINDDLKINIIKDLFYLLYLISKNTNDSTILEMAELYAESVIDYNSALQYINNSEIFLKKEKYLKDYKSDISFYFIYNILENDDKREQLSSILSDEYNNTLYSSILVSLYPYEKIDLMTSFFTSAKKKGAGEIFYDLEASTRLYINNIKQTHDSLKKIFEELFHLHLPV